MYQNKSQYGFYYKCPKCGKIIETKGQRNNNNQWFSKRIDYVGKK